MKNSNTCNESVNKALGGCKNSRSFCLNMDYNTNVSTCVSNKKWSALIYKLFTWINFIFLYRPICYHIIRKKSVGDMTVTPYTTALTASFLWLVYGYVVQDPAVINVNIIAVLLQIMYIFCYFMFTSKKVNYLHLHLNSKLSLFYFWIFKIEQIFLLICFRVMFRNKCL